MSLCVDKDGSITLTRGDTAYLRFIPQVKNKTTNEWEDRTLVSGDRVIFRLATSPNVFEKDCVINIEENTAKLTLVPEDTMNLNFQTYYYEAELVTVLDEHFTFLPHRRFTIGKEEEEHA